MRELIARTLAWVRFFSAPSRQRQSTTEAAAKPEAAPVSPWSLPWTSPSKEEARTMFAETDWDTIELGAIREHFATTAVTA